MHKPVSRNQAIKFSSRRMDMPEEYTSLMIHPCRKYDRVSKLEARTRKVNVPGVRPNFPIGTHSREVYHAR